MSVCSAAAEDKLERGKTVQQASMSYLLVRRFQMKTSGAEIIKGKTQCALNHTIKFQ